MPVGQDESGIRARATGRRTSVVVRTDAYVAVHGGAGAHGYGVEKDLKRVLRE